MNIKYKILIGIILAGAIVGVIYFFGLTNEISYAASFTKAPGTAADDNAVGTVTWSNVDNVKVDDTSEATATYGESHYLKVTNFGFAIPAGSTIDGVIASIGRRGTTFYDIHDLAVRLVVGGSVTGDNKGATTVYWPVNSAQKDYGSATDKWGNTLTASVVNDSNFGFVLESHAEISWSMAYVDYMYLTVYYSEAPPSTSNFFLLF